EPRTMKELTLFQFEQQKELALEKLDLEKERSKYYQEKNQISRQRSKLASNNLQTKEALIFIDKKTKGNSVIYLNYLVNNAGWDPVYNFHAKKDSKNVVVEFNANVHQISGENWNDISLTLSNASPALSAMSPGISPFRVELSSGSSAASMGAPNDITVQTRAISNKLSQAYQKQLESKNWKESQEYSWDMNSAANEYQGLELIANDEDINILKKDSETAFAPSVQFELDGKVSLDSKKQQQLIRVNRAELPSKLYMVSTPILTAYVYREAEIQNNAIEVLLKGPVSVYLDDSFVGKAELPVIARGQSFVMGFGIDSQLRAKRELVEKKERVMGGNKELSFNISISIENFHSTEIPVRILDRIPLDEKKDNLRISLDLKGNELSKDELYQKTEKTKGILRWEISIPANSSGAKAKNLEYSYRLEFDKNLKIQLPGSEKKEKLKQEFEEIQKMRYKY
ncbi:MAG: DUF4139 domain-containing protein, partial [Leptospiraceae bacterium]|nr:DUF4139 domain-containing protein [Leptospiraceae bacterium]